MELWLVLVSLANVYCFVIIQMMFWQPIWMAAFHTSGTGMWKLVNSLLCFVLNNFVIVNTVICVHCTTIAVIPLAL